MANVDYNTKLRSMPFGSYLTTGDLSKSLSSVLPASAEQPQNFMDNALQLFGKYNITPDQSTLSNLILSQALLGPKTPGFSEKDGLKDQLDYASQKKREEADYRQQLGEQSTKKALMYSTIAKLPEQMANAFSPYGGQTGALMAYEGMSRIPEIYRNTLASTPQMNISVPGYSAQQPRYFS